MASPIPVLINRSAGAAAGLSDGLAPAVRDAFAAIGCDIVLELLDGGEVAEAVRRHEDSLVIAVGGGDGTIGAAATALAHRPCALAVLPLGTRNHFARQFGIPLDLAGAARVAARGQRRRIDIGMAGDRIFVNNASFGIYVRFLRQQRRGTARGWLTSIAAGWHALRRFRAQRFSLWIDGERQELRTPLLFIGNNEYAMDLRHLGERASMEDGCLSLYAVAARSPLQLLGFAARALAGLGRPERDFVEYVAAHDVTIEGHGLMEGAFDGELASLPLPLRLRSLPGGLGIVTPRETARTRDAVLSSKSRIL